MKRLSRILVVLAFAVMATNFAVADDIGFTGNYAAGNWTFFNNGSNASGSITPTTMTITGGNIGNGIFGSSSTGYSVTAAYAATISFTWSFTSYDSDGTGYDYPFYITVNGNSVICCSGFNQSTTQGGTLSFQVNAGDVFGFGVYSTDQGFGPGQLTISNFSSTAEVPEPATLFLLGSGLVGAAGTLRKRFAKA